jgi:hypothetical protein
LGNTGVLRQGKEMKLQRNILAKYKDEDDKVTQDLTLKRREFEQRINFCKDKQNKIVQIRDQVISCYTTEYFNQNSNIKRFCFSYFKNQHKIEEYSAFINEKETIRKRAIIKYQTELKAKFQKMLEYDILMKQLEEIRIV